MSKDPAFLFYPNDYLGGTMGMTFDEKGAYMELLMLQFNRGHMTKHMIGQTIGQLFGRIEDKFEVDEQGLYYNKRLEEEINKRKNFVKSRCNNRLGVNQHNKKDEKQGGHMTSHMENENEDIYIDTNSIENSITIPDYLTDVFNAFVGMRKQLKKPMTDKAKQLFLNKLFRFSDDKAEQIQIIEQSIEHSWTTIYELKKPKQKSEGIDFSGGYLHG